MMEWLNRHHRENRPHEAQPGAVAMWFGVLAGPLAWGVAFMVSVFLIRGDCLAPIATSRYILLAAGLVVSASGVLISWRNWLHTRDERATSGGLRGSSRFLSIAGLAWSGISVLMIVGLLVTLLALDPCSAGRLDVRL